jgi:hypothetical protein
MVGADHGRGRGKAKYESAQPIVVQTQHGDVVVAAPEQPTAEAIVPLGFVSGATPPPGTVVALPQIADDQSLASVMEQRGRRRTKDDIVEGFDDLTTPDDES